MNEINSILEVALGISRTDGLYWTNTIKNLESQISILTQDLTGISAPVIYNNGIIDVTTDTTMSTQWTIDDVYVLIGQLNKLRIIYLFDFGYEGDLNMNPSNVIMSREPMFTGSGYLSTFTSVNNISFAK